MRASLSFQIQSANEFVNQLCRYISCVKHGFILNSNGFESNHSHSTNLHSYQLLASIGALEVIIPESKYFDAVRDLIAKGDWIFGYLGYDLKNSIEKLTSNNIDELKFPEMCFVVPEVVITVTNNQANFLYHPQKTKRTDIEKLINDISQKPKSNDDFKKSVRFIPRFTRNEYLDTINRVLSHIQRGDIYEMNLCQEFYAIDSEINPYETYINLNRISPTPFSAFGRIDFRYFLCASPERYLKKKGDKIVSQPIKGTIRRSSSTEENRKLMDKLSKDEKERAENIMIVDLVRNDLSRVAEKASVRVDELCGVYPFQQVNQMISTISCSLRRDKDAVNAIVATFPMGSMTGAPKVRAMELIEHFERSKRGVFSGAIGYISPCGDFDFNVVIRTILYNASNRYISYSVGGAITANSIPENEYEECLLKASAMEQALGVNIIL